MRESLRPVTLLKKTLTKVFLCEICNYFDKHLNVQFLILFKKRLQHSCFSVNFVNYTRTHILLMIYQRLVLKNQCVGLILVKLQA